MGLFRRHGFGDATVVGSVGARSDAPQLVVG
jgi:hypothetical protein